MPSTVPSSWPSGMPFGFVLAPARSRSRPDTVPLTVPLSCPARPLRKSLSTGVLVLSASGFERSCTVTPAAVASWPSETLTCARPARALATSSETMRLMQLLSFGAQSSVPRRLLTMPPLRFSTSLPTWNTPRGACCAVADAYSEVPGVK